MKNIKLFVMAALLCIVFTLHSQDEVRVFKTQEYTQNYVVNHQDYFPNKREIEKSYKAFLKNGEIQDFNVNLIFHNLYATSQEMIHHSVINRQIEILNENFSAAKYPDPPPSIYHEKFENRFCENTRINFCLVSPQTLIAKNEPYNPVNYVPVSTIEWTVNNHMKHPSGGHPVVLPELLINVWIVNLEGNLAGFSQVPGGNSNFDGIVIDYNLLKNIDAPIGVSRYNEGKSLTHLIANYLNVNDLWSETNSCGDDSVRDTPIHNAPNYHCYEALHMTTCEKKPSIEMLNNFMDATPDACQYYFTHGQMMRMQSILSKEGFRHSLTELGCDVHFKNPDLASTRKSLDKFGFKIFPNPSNGAFNIEFYGLPPTTFGKISIIDKKGVKILEKPILGTKEPVNFNLNGASPNQLYFVKFLSNRGEIIIEKLIINQ